MDEAASEVNSTQPEKRAWWLVTRRRRAEWQSLMLAGIATFTGRPRANFEAAQPGDPVLLYVSKPEHAIRAVGVIGEGDETEGRKQKAEGRKQVGGENPTPDTRSPTPDPRHPSPTIDVQLAFEVTNPLAWKDIAATPELSDAEPVKQRSSGTLFSLTEAEYDSLKAMIVQRNPELEGAFAAVDAGATHIQASNNDEAATEQIAVLREESGGYAPIQDVPENLPTITSLHDLQLLTGLPYDLLEEARDLLEDTGQIVLVGPPGTGKTWLARGLAALEAGDPARAQVVQFHPSVTYEDFIEGLKPVVDEMGRVSYAVLPGQFLRLCEQARHDPEHHYVLVIDEINRAPLARVFGELLYALEYRGPQGAVQLSLSAGQRRQTQPFYVPENLLIIATMNSADRSLALVDYALRRRFRFVELEPNPTVLDQWLQVHDNSPETRRIVLELFERVNNRLSEELDPDHKLGHSYFMLDPLTGQALDRLWRTAIRPLIREYFIPPSGELEEYRVLFAEAGEQLDERR